MTPRMAPIGAVRWMTTAARRRPRGSPADGRAGRRKSRERSLRGHARRCSNALASSSPGLRSWDTSSLRPADAASRARLTLRAGASAERADAALRMAPRGPRRGRRAVTGSRRAGAAPWGMTIRLRRPGGALRHGRPERLVLFVRAFSGANSVKAKSWTSSTPARQALLFVTVLALGSILSRPLHAPQAVSPSSARPSR